jgi:hypothetical protein
MISCTRLKTGGDIKCDSKPMLIGFIRISTALDKGITNPRFKGEFIVFHQNSFLQPISTAEVKASRITLYDVLKHDTLT